MENIKKAGEYVSESIQGATSSASKEVNKNIAKDSDASLTDRATATKDMVGDKVEEHGHNTKASVDKEAAKH